MRTTAFLLTLALVALAVTATAGDKPAVHKKTTLEGKLVCLGCDLKKSDGAHAACSIYGHKHALKTKDGKHINFLENDYSKDLINGEKYHNKGISVAGVYYDKANMLDVETFTVDDTMRGWCGHCKAMDNCPFGGRGKM